MLNLTLKELRLIAKNRNMGGYKSIRKDKLLRLFTYQKHQTIFLLIYLTLKTYKSGRNTQQAYYLFEYTTSLAGEG